MISDNGNNIHIECWNKRRRERPQKGRSNKALRSSVPGNATMSGNANDDTERGSKENSTYVLFINTGEYNTRSFIVWSYVP